MIKERFYMDEQEYVFCTHCEYFPMEQINAEDFPVHCFYEQECHFWDWEDGRRFYMRKCYKPKIIE